MTEYEFEVDVSQKDADLFAEISGDFNPLHTDHEYAIKTKYRHPVLHGAFSAGLLSRMAGMHIPGKDCLLHGIKLKFIAPILPPARLRINGKLVRDNKNHGLVEVIITDSNSGAHYVSGSYEFGRHLPKADTSNTHKTARPSLDFAQAPILVTGASGGLGSAILDRLGRRGLGISRSSSSANVLSVSDLTQLPRLLEGRKISGIIHCGWPSPDNQKLIELGSNTDAAVNHHVAGPLCDTLKLAQTLSDFGNSGATLVLIGSTAASPGRHNWRMPLYSIGKSIIPTLVKALAVELGARNQLCLGLTFDVIEGGMNDSMIEPVRLAHIDRSPFGKLPTAEDAAEHLVWMLDNTSFLISGAVIDLSGGALP